jgi:group I intron endonuclease
MIIYKVTNNTNGMIYIGQTSQTLEKRKNIHKYESKHSKRHFCRAINKYGMEGFTWEIIFNCFDKKEMDEMEKFFIANYKAYNYLYNLTDGGDGAFGYNHTEENKNKLSKIMTGKIRSEEHCRNISKSKKGSKNPMFGKKQSSETINKRREKMIGHETSKETRSKISLANNGRIRKDRLENSNNWINIDKNKIIELRNKGVSGNDIAKEFNVSPWTIYFRLKNMDKLK